MTTSPAAASTAAAPTTTIDNDIHKDEDKEEQDPMAVLDRILKSPSRHQERQRQEYLERLASFSAAGLAYFAKPASISPLVCARFG
eukprot:scaffold34597_cov177-Amphora_coffeaeformis.AAC.31